MIRRRRKLNGEAPVNSTKAVAYVRVSSTEQAVAGVSLDAQAERLAAYAQAQGLELVAILREEAVSGTVPLSRREQGAALLRAVETGAARHVLALKLDRLFRDTADALNVTRAWDKASVALHLVDLGGTSINTGSAMGRMFLTMTAAFAEFERNLTGERTALALAHKRARGEHVGIPPRGTRIEGKHLVVSDLAIFRRARDLRASGKTYAEIGTILAAEGFTPIRGRRFWPSSIHALLHNSNLAKLAANEAA